MLLQIASPQEASGDLKPAQRQGAALVLQPTSGQASVADFEQQLAQGSSFSKLRLGSPSLQQLCIISFQMLAEASLSTSRCRQPAAEVGLSISLCCRAMCARKCCCRRISDCQRRLSPCTCFVLAICLCCRQQRPAVAPGSSAGCAAGSTSPKDINFHYRRLRAQGATGAKKAAQSPGKAASLAAEKNLSFEAIAAQPSPAERKPQCAVCLEDMKEPACGPCG